jgi:hypothetical protein
VCGRDKINKKRKRWIKENGESALCHGAFVRENQNQAAHVTSLRATLDWGSRIVARETLAVDRLWKGLSFLQSSNMKTDLLFGTLQ